MLPEKDLELVHFQITRSCNLRCWFCGQWGRKGFFSNASGSPMDLDDWKRVIASLVRYRKDTGKSPSVILWGGEPLTSPDFQAIADCLFENGFELGLVTNGVLIDKWAEVIKRDFKKIYVSIDGTRDVHDSIRGRGVFDRVSANIKLLCGSNVEIAVMTVMSPAVIGELERLPEEFSSLNPSELLLHEMIYMTDEEIKNYSKWFESNFGRKPSEINSWQMAVDAEFEQQKERVLERMEKKSYPFSVKIMRHGKRAKRDYCLSPFKHIHVAWNGNVLYCTDFYDFSAGNVKNEDVIDIFNNSLSDTFRREAVLGNCASCSHCSWKNSSEFGL